MQIIGRPGRYYIFCPIYNDSKPADDSRISKSKHTTLQDTSQKREIYN